MQNLIKTILALISIFIVSSTVLSKETFDPNKVEIKIDHGVEVANQRPGFKLSIINWIPNEKIKIIVIAPSGEKIELDNNSVKADSNGLSIIGIDYQRKGFYKGTWVMVIAGKAGIHQLTMQLPSITPPSATNKNWVVNFE